MTKIQIGAWVIGGIAIIVGVLTWSAKHDVQVEIAAQLYENCIRVEYGVGPAQWRAEHGEYPVCVNVEDYK